ncbi:uncharacterized protein [Venturia canescens]|uniref:uncharacterized protein n=1 Tax=Venturia canescens TaxID=32260 RepID=UPI001C9C9E4D|nr:uncharacterized protein LOC122412441 [Venturia canescens]
MWKGIFAVCAVIVASVSSAPSFSNEEDAAGWQPTSEIDQLIVKFRTQFMVDLENFSKLVDEVETAESQYNRELEAQISDAVTQARHEIEQIFERIPPHLAADRCKEIADELGPFTSDTLNNVTECIANKMPSNDKPSVFDVAADGTRKLFAMKDEMSSCGGTIINGQPDYEYSDEDYEEYDMENLEASLARENVNCSEVRAKVSEVLQEITDSFADLFQTSYDNISSLGEFANECEMAKDYVKESKAIVESVRKCTQSASDAVSNSE